MIITICSIWLVLWLSCGVRAYEDDLSILLEKYSNNKRQLQAKVAPGAPLPMPKVPTKPPPGRRAPPSKSGNVDNYHKSHTPTRPEEHLRHNKGTIGSLERGRTSIRLTDYRKWGRENEDKNAPCSKSKKRFGGEGDGGKWVCMALVPQEGRNCLILSIGSGNDFSWEVEMHVHWPHCKIHVFDGTNYGKGPPSNVPGFLTFHDRDFKVGTNEELDNALEGSARVDILKIDCEGCEYNSLMPFLRKVETSQVLIEIHGCISKGFAKNMLLMKALSPLFSVFSNEPNFKHSDGTCIEFGLARRPGKRFGNETEQALT